MLTLLRDVAGDGAQKAANKVNPDQEALDNIDEPAQENQWHDNPDMSRDNLKNTMKSKSPFSKQDLQDAKNDAQNAGQQGNSNSQGALKGAMRAADNLQSKAKQNVDDDTQDQARERKDRLKQYAKDKICLLYTSPSPRD